MTDYQPHIITDKSELSLIFKFRVTCYENSPYRHIVNSAIFPNGWYDELDKDSDHWLIKHEKRIIGSARASIISNFDQLSLSGIVTTSKPIKLDYPVGLISRLVIAKDYRRLGLANKFDLIRLNRLSDKRILTVLAEARTERVKPLKRLGFEEHSAVLFSPTKNAPTEKLTLLIKNENKLGV